MKTHRKKFLASAVLLCLILGALAYTRPLTIAQRYPMLDLSSCTGIHGYFNDTKNHENIPFEIAPDDPRFQQVITLFQNTVFQTKLGNLLPKGTKIHPYQEGDFKWEVMFRFEDVRFPNGSSGSGDLLQIRNFYGDVELFFDGESVSCSVKNRDSWLAEVLSLIK